MRYKTVGAMVMTIALVLPTAGFAQQASMQQGTAMTMGDEPEAEGAMHQGFWIGLGMGAGSLGFGGDASGGDRESGLSGNFRIGGTISPQFLLGAETNGWYKNVNGSTVSTGALSLVGYFYPSTGSGFFLKGGLGAMTYSEDGFESMSGGSAQIGLGYDFPIGSHSAINLYANYIASKISTDAFGPSLSFNPSILQAGAGIAWY